MTGRARLPYDFMPTVPSFELRSDDVADGQMMSQNQVFDGFGMTGRNISSSLSWSGFPAQTKNFAVTLFDPDAPTGSGWWHWVVLGIPASVTKLEAGAAGTGGSGLPEGVFHVRNDYMVKDFGGAAPPEGDPPHRYVFAVHALDVESLGVSDEISPAKAGFNLRFHTIARALLIPCTATDLQQRSPQRAGSQPGRLASWASSHGDISARWRLSGEVCAG
jgi:Raf kinase inhibitor-like YbhB/YbcL family protein